MNYTTGEKEITENKIYESIHKGVKSIKLCVFRYFVVNFHFFEILRFKPRGITGIHWGINDVSPTKEYHVTPPNSPQCFPNEQKSLSSFPCDSP